MNLYGAGDLSQIEQAYRDIMETYSNNSVTLKVASNSVDRFNEDRGDITFTDYTFLAIVIFGKNPDQADPNLGGAVDITKAQVIVHMDILAALGLLDSNNMPTIATRAASESLMVINGQNYIINDIAQQGHIEGSRQVKCHFDCQIDKQFYP